MPDKATVMAPEAGLTMDESQKERDARMGELWKKLDYQHKGELDWKALQRGLHKVDHPLKNADDMLKSIVEAVDGDGDGKIQYEEFRVFVQAAERQLYKLFRSIDRDNNGRLDKEELRIAFKRAGLTIPNRRLSRFFDDIDLNEDGFISFEEWRDFLLFMPNSDAAATLHAVITFYSDVVTLTSEGDSVLSDSSLHSLGTRTSSLLHHLFGIILKIASPAPHQTRPVSKYSEPSKLRAPSLHAAEKGTSISVPPRTASTAFGEEAADMKAAAHVRTIQAVPAHVRSSGATTNDSGLSDNAEGQKKSLIKYLPDSGYFVAGAVAGGVSRTATAPLDRLKVYLLVNTKSATNLAVDAAKQGRPAMAVKVTGRPLVTAIGDLYKTGGVRGFFAGNGLNVIKIMPETAIRFGAYEAAKRTLAGFEGHGNTAEINPISKFVAGGVAGMTAQFCVYPLDTLKFRLQSEYTSSGPRGNRLVLQVLQNMWADGGHRAAYRGVTMGLIGMFPYSAIDMGTFDFLKTRYVQYVAKAKGIHEEDVQPSTWATGIMGASSGAFGASVVYPLNVLRTRLQTQGTMMHPARYTGIWDVAQKTVKHEGVRGLYKGLMPNLLKVAPALSITWMVYENAKRFMDLH